MSPREDSLTLGFSGFWLTATVTMAYSPGACLVAASNGHGRARPRLMRGAVERRGCRLARQKKIEPDQPVEVLFTAREREVLLQHVFADDDLMGCLRVAELRGSKSVANYTLDDLDELIGYVAAEANHATDKKLAKELYALFDRLQAEMQSYDDGQWPNDF